MKKLIFIALLFMNAGLYAAVPVAILPFEGTEPKSTEYTSLVKELFIKTDGISVVADKFMQEIINIHEKAQAMGSDYHDISKLKIAEYLVLGNLSGNKLTLKVIDVNQGTEIYGSTVDLSGDPKRALKKAVKDMSEKILFRVSSRGEEVPSEAAPYMDTINGFVNSLSQGDEASYRYMAIYSKGTYVHPDKDNKKSVDNAKRFLKLVREKLNNSKVTYISMKADKTWIYVNVIAEKSGKQMKIKFGFIELEDGSMAIGICDEEK